MEKILRVIFLVFTLLSQNVSATEAHILVGNDGSDRATAAKSIVYGAVLGTLVATAASLVNEGNRAYLFTFFIGAGAAGGLGSYLLQPASATESSAFPNRVTQKPPGVSVGLFSWGF